MSKNRGKAIKMMGLVCLTASSFSLIPSARTSASEPSLSILQTDLFSRDRTFNVQGVSDIEEQAAPMEQVTSVSQLSDVQPTDWAFQALQSLVERYGCIAGYPDRTFRGNRAITRYEFAAGLNACLDRVNELIAAATADLVQKGDLLTLQKLQEEFSAELATLRGRVDVLETRTIALEKQQFSTTTKLTGEAIFSLASASGAYPGGNLAFFNNTNPVNQTQPTPGRDAEVVFNNRVRLNLVTSFSGRDQLITGLQAYNFGGGPSSVFRSNSGSLAGTLGYGDVIFGNASNLSLAYTPQFPTVNPQDFASTGNNAISLYKLLYIFPVVNKLTAFVGTNAEVSDAFPAILPFAGEGQGAVSRFGSLPVSQRVSSGTSQTGLAAAAGLIWNISDTFDFRALYGNVTAPLPGDAGFFGTPLGAGVFKDSYILSSQLTIKPSQKLDIGLNYAHSHHKINILGTGLASADFGTNLFNPTAAELTTAGGSALVAIVDQPIHLNTLGATAAFRVTPSVTLAGSATYIFSELENVDASTNFLSWLVGVHFKDAVSKGSTAGLLFGRPLSRVSTAGRAFSPEDATPYQLEGYINFRLTDNLSITPGIFFIFNPEGFRDNPTVTVPVVRTTFTF